MRSLFRGRLAGRYIFFEMLPSFTIGVIVFVSILLMFQALRLTEFVLVHGVSFKTIGQIVVYLTVSFLPAILPMSLLFAVLLTYGRLSQDSEIVAMKAAGLSLYHLLTPAFVIGVVVALASAETSFNIGPWGNRQFEVLVTELGSTKIVDTIRGGTFAEGFFDRVVYAHEVDSQKNLLSKVFIYDASNEKLPITIIAQQGRLIPGEEKGPGRRGPTTLHLTNGSIHRTQDETYTKINFKNYDVLLSLPSATSFREKSPQSLTYRELHEILVTNIETEKRLTLETELQKRWAISFACIVFSMLGVGLGTVTNRRSARSSGLMISLGVIIAYWTFYVAGENLARHGTISPWLAIWTPNILFVVIAIHYLRRAWQ